MIQKLEEIKMKPIGFVKVKGEDTMSADYSLEIFEKYRPALKELESFSHVMVFWWAHQNDSEEIRNSKEVLTVIPPYGDQTPETGIFATRSEFRPNPIALTTSKIVDIDQHNGSVKLTGIDALDGTPIVDLKAYFPICDRIRDCYIAPWLEGWPEWQEEGFEWWVEQGFFKEYEE
ncbi:MAG: tRNA (N6-threonylcarbamoyladenosine(37)-N6)-methyltransferase TrmO [Candidatus Lokiarchaeota archaeon]|nr:tRNA (N6-threonylcarbamoyladenosine(37)-N6)-methyltransferase TrmO [Candidatus Lokiarchaeota archaeon]MBD3201561.1 tRNA (N6-threonylcarbamoyladenosine(37)-N6)-methyltransferase TrmO [Candidatus Lokiarchaeota archaeon]